MPKSAQVLLMLSLAAFASLVYGPVSTAQERGKPPGEMSLLPGYTHQRLPGVDTENGRIAKVRGLVITYDIGTNAGDKARGYAENNPEAWTFTLQRVDGGRATVTVDEPRQFVTVTIDGDANFEARDVKSKRDLAELLAMALTYDRAKHLGMKK